MRPRHLAYLAVLAVAVPGAIYWAAQSPDPDVAAEPAPTVRSVPPAEGQTSPELRKKFLGDRVLEYYAAAGGSGKSDLRLLHGFVSNALLLSKQADPRHYATNEDLALLLLGEKGNQEQLLSASHPALSASGQIVDRWNSPVIVHVPRAGVIDLRSAGPDRTPYTPDDIEWPIRTASPAPAHPTAQNFDRSGPPRSR